MKLLCLIFGHQPPIYAEKGWYSPGEEYARVVMAGKDGVGRCHAHVESECPRCGEIFKLARIHIPEIRSNVSLNDIQTEMMERRSELINLQKKQGGCAGIQLKTENLLYHYNPKRGTKCYDGKFYVTGSINGLMRTWEESEILEMQETK